MGDGTIQAQPQPAASADPTRLRLWPAIVLVALLWLIRAAVSIGEFSPGKFFFGLVITPMGVVAGLLLWTLFASRLPRLERLLIAGTFVAVTVATILIAGSNFPVMALVLYAAPIVSTLWAGWLLLTIPWNWPVRRVGLIVVFVAVGAACSQIRVDGMDGEFRPKFSWRWTPTPEQQMLSSLNVRKVSTDSAITELTVQPEDWPCFRGINRDGRLAGLQINTNWDQAPPQELWRHRIGPGWSSFSVVGDLVYTQEQRGDEEFVVCYDAGSGNEIWSHHDVTRFSEVVAGAGPRATPTIHDGRLYALGGSGKLNCLNATNGKLIWGQDLVVDTKATVPTWGFSSSPLIAHGLVTVFAGAPEGKSVAAYDAETGKLAWTAGEGLLSYCSPQLAKFDGVEQVLMITDAGLMSFDPATGKELWKHAWLAQGIARVVQPAIVGDHDVLIGTGMGVGTRRISVTREAGAWQTKEKWTTREIKPYYNDFVISDNHMYGFDGNIFMCVNLDDGSRKWRARGYGNGQVLLLADQALLLILSEQGEVALVNAAPDAHHEVARFKAIEGKTWNHPVVCRGKLFVRNAEEIACFRLAKESGVKERTDGVDQNSGVSAQSE